MSLLAQLVAATDPASAVLLGVLVYRVERSVMPRLNRLESEAIDG